MEITLSVILIIALHAWAWSALQADQRRQREEGW